MPDLSTETLTRALGSIVADFRREIARDLDAASRQMQGMIAEAKASVAEAEARRDAILYEIRRAVDERMAQVRDGIDGKDGRDGIDGKDGADGKDGERGPQGEPGPPGRDGIDGRDGADGRDGIDGEQGPAGASGRDGADGRDGEAGRDGADGANGKDGASVMLDDVLPTLQKQVADYLATIPKPQDGKDGADGKDGEPGPEGRSVNPRGTFSPDEEYARLDLVVLNGSGFIAIKDDPGPCPGAGWQLHASRGSRGERGERGLPGRDGLPGKDGAPGPRGAPGASVAAYYEDGDDQVITLDDGQEHRLKRVKK